MFTGLVEELGSVVGVRASAGGLLLSVRCSTVLEGSRVGDSIAVNGACLTVVEIGVGGFQAEVMPETVAKTNLASLRPGDSVNLERSLRLGDRLGGHLVTGHVDGVGRIVQRTRTGDSTVIRIKAPDAVQRYVVSKGSVAVDGISLTVADRLEDGFTISLIPHTARVTNVGLKSVGATVNLEGDIIGKYVERMLEGRTPSLRGLTAERLSDLGYIK